MVVVCVRVWGGGGGDGYIHILFVKNGFILSKNTNTDYHVALKNCLLYGNTSLLIQLSVSCCIKTQKM